MATPKRIKTYVGWAFVLLGAVLIALWVFRLGRAALSLRAQWRQAQSWAEAPGEVDPALACRLVQDAQRDLQLVQREAGFLVSLAPAAGWLPGVGGDLRAAPHLLTTGVNVTGAGRLLCDIAQPILPWPGHGSSAAADVSPARVLGQLAERRSELEQAGRAVEAARGAWARVDAGTLSPRLRRRASLLDRGLPLLHSAVSAVAVAPDLLGVAEPRTYLILALNEDELRPGGGFISGVGEVRIEAGQVVTMTFRDSYGVDDFTQPYPDAPEPMQRYMGIDLWTFRDSNWSPDFPTAAEQAVALYRPGDPVSIDGVMALDQQAVQALVAAVGPLRVEGADEAITGETVLHYMRQAWAPGEEEWTRDWWRERKSFMGAIAEGAWREVEEGDVDWVALGRSVLRLLEQKHMMVHTPDPTIQEILAAQGWDGALRVGPGDYLAVIEANVGYNKANARVEQRVVYQVDLRQAPTRATLALTHTHTSDARVDCRPESRYAPTYKGMMERCYWGYLRIYVPRRSQLLEATAIPLPGEVLWSGEAESGAFTVGAAEEAPALSWEVLAVIAPGTTQTRYLTWTLPPDVVRWDGQEGTYTLRVQKQPGKAPHPLTVRVQLPQGTALVDAWPPPSSTGPGWVTYDAVLDGDLTFDLDFRREP